MNTTKDMQLISISELVPYVNNARTHSPEQVLKLRASLREFGFVSPVIIDKDKNILVGHGRVQAAKEEGITEVPCVIADYLTEAQKKAYILADNRLALDAGWDEELLRIEIEALQGADFDLSLMGFDDAELSALFDLGTEATDDGFDESEELEKPAITRNGDVWQIGKHKVICADSTLPETYQTLLGDIKVNLVCTDAPYFVNLESASGKIRNDDLDDKQAYEFLLKVFTCFKQAMAKDASIYEFYATSKSRIFWMPLKMPASSSEQALFGAKSAHP
ncbi:ParB/Srx family N-terminal domain-containing protein [Corynebacterium poyangense]|uniref:ParB/Srx family N-terminal domain-containing protein n=1 Tax=Corynebacterium poyangense TaxID=2684405 RepID=UPI001CCF1135|nr:ParB/Srx family N-terminal domain-containing protein [Corynebacterium poyangense]